MRPLYLAGATGGGKSSVAVALAEHTRGEIVNADAYQLYRGIEILSAAPSEADRNRVPHHLYGALDLTSECNAARYAELAEPCIAQVTKRGVLPIVVGGSGLYLKSLTHGLADLPAADPALRLRLDTLSDEELVSKLQELDPVGAEQTNLLNRRYVSRAVEICLLSGRPMSEVKAAWRDNEPEFDGVLIERPREELYARINARVPKMLAAGLIDEVAALPPKLSNTASKAIAIREVRAHLADELTLDECVAAIQQASRRYAKRQLTWLRRETGFQKVCLSESESAESAARRIRALFTHLPHA